MLHLPLALVLTCTWSQETPPLVATEPDAPVAEQETAPAETEPAEEPAAPPAEPPTSVDEAIQVPLDQLAADLEPLSNERLEEHLAAWMALLEAQQAAYASAEAAGEGSELKRTASSLGSDRDALIARVEVVIQSLADHGGEIEGARARIEEIRSAETEQLGRITTVPVEQQEAQRLDLEVLRAQLRPLTKEQVEEQLRQWIELLQEKCLEVRRVEVAALESKDSSEIEKFNERAVVLRGERARLLERVRAVIDSIEEKGGEVTDARAYVKSVVVTPPISGLRAAWTTARTWFTNPDGGLALAKTLLVAALILGSFWALSRVLGKVAERALRRVKRTSELLREFLITSVEKMVLLIGVLVALGQVGVDMAPMLAAIGAAGLVIGLALQGTLSNFASGLMIMFYRPFDVGDVVNAAGTGGKVQGMSLVTTTIKTFDNQTIYVPNNKIWNDVITNVTANTTRRVDLVVGVSYEDDLDRTIEVLYEVVRAHPMVLADPAPNVRVFELADSSVNLIVRPWTQTENYWEVYWDLTKQIKQRLDAENISIPFPQRDVHVHAVPSGGGNGELVPSKAEPKGERSEEGAVAG